MKRFLGLVALGATVMFSAPSAWAGRIKLTALPERDRVEIQLDNGRYTLVEEERIVPLLKSTIKTGNNRIDFSWSNTHIDKDSIQLRALAILVDGKQRPIRVAGEQREIAVINVAYPPNENALVWEVFAANGYAVKFRVSYLISNLTRTFLYRALVDKNETVLDLKQYIQLRNYSGEGFGRTGVLLGYGGKLLDPRSVGQQEDIKMLLSRFKGVPVHKTFTFDWYRFGPLNDEKRNASKVLMHYEIANQPESGLGAMPLEPGKVRIYIADSRGGQAFLGEDWGKVTPIGAKMRLFVGQARDVVCERMVEAKETRDVRGDLDHLEVTIRYEIENFKKTAVRLDIIEQLDRVADQFYPKGRHGVVDWVREPGTSSEIEFSYPYGGSSPVLGVTLPPRPVDGIGTDEVKKTIVKFRFTIRNLWR